MGGTCAVAAAGTVAAVVAVVMMVEIDIHVGGWTGVGLFSGIGAGG